MINLLKEFKFRDKKFFVVIYRNFAKQEGLVFLSENLNQLELFSENMEREFFKLAKKAEVVRNKSLLAKFMLKHNIKLTNMLYLRMKKENNNNFTERFKNEIYN